MIFNLTPQSLDHIVTVLMERPYREVKVLIEDLVEQANNQPKEQNVAVPTPTDGSR